MPGSIKIDDGSGNYTILTNAGSLGSDKTLTIPNETATLATTTDVNNITTGNLVKLSSATASNSSELVFDNFVDTSTYSYYHIVAENIIPATTSTNLLMTFRQGGASGSDLNGTYYLMAWAAFGNVSIGGFDSNASTSNFAQIGDALESTAGAAHNGAVEYFPSDGTNNGSYMKTNFVSKSSASNIQSRHRAQYLDSTTAATGARFYMSSGNITSGSIYIYGVKK